ncbi:MAG: phosphoenolpyruvate--protein phosphotransferase [Acidobacteria bacterium]|nr:phosphoenolpyruvate--protein phosphotransferase [Acidobacteriota bacterium]MCA1639975.1 phosphoenolpyruvate--protein phosphotransferase [Acidobacteriota bacterium]
MIVLGETNQISQTGKKNGEIKLSGRAVSRGISIGKVVCLHGRKRQFYRTELKKSQIEQELRRFRVSVRLAKLQLKKIGGLKSENSDAAKVNIFDAHRLILEDNSLLTKIETFIQENKVNAEWAVKMITDAYIAKYKTIADDYLRERYVDLEDVAERLLTALGGDGRQNIRLEKDSIIVAREIKPSTLIELTECQPKAIITERGGWTSHSFILAREINLPAVTGVKGVLRHVKTGDEVIVDGFNGQVIFNPSKETTEKFKLVAEEIQQLNFENSENFEAEDEKLQTLDGREIILRANIDLPTVLAKANNFRTKGIGLYRSEFLFNQNKGFPSEQQQIEAYRNIAELAGEEGVKIRTFDSSFEQFADESAEREQNPALGLRGIRLGLSNKEQFRIQLRALLQASAANNIDIILPMVSEVSEILLTREILENEKSRLKKRKVKYGNPRIGAMIEIPATVFIIEELAREADFLSLGTNDLVQYLLAVDRDNESVAEWFRTLHPAVIRAVKKVIQAAENNNTPLIVCGEMAGSPVYAAILIGLGATELSMNLNSIARIRKTVSGIAFEEAREISKQLENCKTTNEVENLVNSFFLKKWSHLFSPESLPLRKNQK